MAYLEMFSQVESKEKAFYGETDVGSYPITQVKRVELTKTKNT